MCKPCAWEPLTSRATAPISASELKSLVACYSATMRSYLSKHARLKLNNLHLIKRDPSSAGWHPSSSTLTPVSSARCATCPRTMQSCGIQSFVCAGVVIDDMDISNSKSRLYWTIFRLKSDFKLSWSHLCDPELHSSSRLCLDHTVHRQVFYVGYLHVDL